MLPDYHVLIQIVEIVLVVSYLNYLNIEKYWLNCHNGDKCWSNEKKTWVQNLNLSLF